MISDDILTNILKFSDMADLSNSASVSKMFKKISSRDSFWDKFLRKDFFLTDYQRERILKNMGTDSLKEVYIRLHVA